MNRIIAPSLLAADFNNLQKEVEMVNQSNAQWLHCDVMDGVFVPNISFGIPVIQSLSKISDKLIDAHLMIVEPDRHIDSFVQAGAQNITVHYEAVIHLHRTIQYIKNKGVMAGVSLNPHTPVSLLEDIAPDLDLVLVMSVNPGYGGQKFIHNSFEKIARLYELLQRRNSKAQIQVDGGVTVENARELYDHGATNLVAGTTVFKSPDPKKTIDELLYV
ncbi:MAG TPA: ribulose-phosphate 3-epimerase [Bacteroidales bacterium]|jgi:ribulose-phosphate 3-epimerase|nr:ribulose-phosphate 3-epimerase [Bacteroidales bacterium]